MFIVMFSLAYLFHWVFDMICQLISPFKKHFVDDTSSIGTAFRIAMRLYTKKLDGSGISYLNHVVCSYMLPQDHSV